MLELPKDRGKQLEKYITDIDGYISTETTFDHIPPIRKTIHAKYVKDILYRGQHIHRYTLNRDKIIGPIRVTIIYLIVRNAKTNTWFRFYLKSEAETIAEAKSQIDEIFITGKAHWQ